MRSNIKFFMAFLLLLAVAGLILSRYSVKQGERKSGSSTAELKADVDRKCQEAERAWKAYQQRYPQDKTMTQQDINRANESQEAIRANEWQQACDEAQADLEQTQTPK